MKIWATSMILVGTLKLRECSFNILTSAAAPAGAAVDAVCVLAGVGRQRSVHSLQLRVTGRRAVLQQLYFNFTFKTD